jgi:hypothetical protein
MLNMKIMPVFVIILFTVISCNEKKASKVNSFIKIPKFEVNIEHFYSAEGETLNWIITKDSLKINYNCDFEGCKDTLLFSSPIDTTNAKFYFNKLVEIPFNDLNANYDKSFMSDGLKENVLIKNIYDSDIKVYMHGKEVQEIDNLYKLTDSLILSKTKFKINSKK